MPLYEYHCTACEHRFERIVKFSDAPLVTCPKCGKDAIEQMISAPAIKFKGSGWYVNDYARKSSPASSSDSSTKSEASSETASASKDSNSASAASSASSTPGSANKSESSGAPSSGTNNAASGNSNSGTKSSTSKDNG